jgi:hypothetical protein
MVLLLVVGLALLALGQ